MILHMRWSIKSLQGLEPNPLGTEVGPSPHREMEGFMNFFQGSSSQSFLLILLRLLLSTIFKIKFASGPLDILSKIALSDEAEGIRRG